MRVTSFDPAGAEAVFYVHTSPADILMVVRNSGVRGCVFHLARWLFARLVRWNVLARISLERGRVAGALGPDAL